MEGSAPSLRVVVPELRYGTDLLFRDLTLGLPGGRTSCLLGPSGSGKTTLLRILAGLEPGGVATAGDGGPLAGRVAYMAQADLLLPWLTVLDNAVLGWRLRGLRGPALARHRERARELLTQVGLARHADALPVTLSGGMRQRAALARTLCEARPIVLMDEPFAALDAITRHRLQDLAAGLLAGRTVVLVTHSPSEALRLGHGIIVLRGRPARVEPPHAPPGTPPRALGDPALAALEARLLDELAAAAALADAP
jgi:putative hydroxymethylpyrimidine transport system ATP-binding protein